MAEPGPEYDVAKAFAEYLGLELEVELAQEFGDLGSLLERRQGEFIAANLTRTKTREARYSFGPDYADATTIVVYKRGKARPRELADLVGMRLAVIAGSSYESQLELAKESFPDLQWTSEKSMGMEDLLLAITDDELDATLVDSNIFKTQQPVLSPLERRFHTYRPSTPGLGISAG